jgi:hypothetical protein
MVTPAQEPGSTVLPFELKVGTWRAQSLRGQGTYGFVYRAVSEAHPGPVALKLSVYPADQRFEREVELLSRIRHPSVPRLLDAGVWQSPLGGSHPFIVMEWVEGEPLYAWAARRNPSSRQVLALLAQAAGALQAVHEVRAVHRDVKGDNMLVRPSDGRLFLTDLGAGYFAGAARRTPPHIRLGTPEYHSPELWESTRRGGPGAAHAMLARPWDDVFALGVTAYRLVTDTYPPPPLPDMKAGQCWRPDGPGAPPPRQLNPRVDAQLNALILRMLSMKPEERGSGLELKEAMERGVTQAPLSADGALFEWETLKPSQWTEQEMAEARFLGGNRPRLRDRKRALEAGQADAAQRAAVERQRVPARAEAPAPASRMHSRRWLPWIAAAMALGLWPEQTGSVRTGEQLTEEVLEAQRRAVSLGDAAQKEAGAQARPPAKKPVAQQLPKQPRPGQLRPNAKGRCPGKLLAINGGCWAKLDVTPEHCPAHLFLHQGECYMPIPDPERVPTSAPGGQ